MVILFLVYRMMGIKLCFLVVVGSLLVQLVVRLQKYSMSVWFDLCGVVLLLADCSDVADQRELLGECNGCARKCS